MKFGNLPRVRLARQLPTPLYELSNLSKLLNGPRIFIKRDDLTGLAFGGNKTRKLEYLMADALKNDADYIVTGAGFQSNWCTQAAAAAVKLGMKCVLIKKGPSDHYDPLGYDGNHLLHFLQGAEIITARPEKVQKVQEEIIEGLKKKGHRPYFLADAGSTPPGVAGYINMMLELIQQSVEINVGVDYLVHATGSGGTQAGLIIGAKALNTGIKIIATSTGSRSKDVQCAKVYNLTSESLKFLNLNIKVDEDDVIVHDQYTGGGYGFISEGKIEAIKMLSETEAIFLDPVYTGAAMACLIDLCRQGYFKKDDVVVFLHTGGAAALFPYKAPLKKYIVEGEIPWKIPEWSPESV
jgi:D-cysteine desulfhydrase family pyridoxal phosphate-dependent enzyme